MLDTEVQHPIYIRTIENGYLIEQYVPGEGQRSWYCISPDEVKHKLDKFL